MVKILKKYWGTEMLGKEDEIEKLVEFIRRSYSYYSPLHGSKERQILDTKEYSEEYSDKEYFQVATRSKVPDWIFDGKASNEQVGSEFGRRIAEGEKDSIVDHLKENAQTMEVYSASLKSPSGLLSSIFQRRMNPTSIILPMTEYKTIYSREYLTLAKFTPRPYLDLIDTKINIYFSKKLDNQLLAFDNKKIDCICKRGRQMPFPENLRSEESKYNKRKTDSDYLQIATIDRQGYVEFIVRSVFSINPKEESVILLNILPNEDDETND